MEMTKKKPKKPSVKCRRESKLLTELCNRHDYMFQKLSHERDRYTSQFKRNKRTNKMTLTPAVCVKLIVPAASALGVKITEMYKTKVKRKAR